LIYRLLLSMEVLEVVVQVLEQEEALAAARHLQI
jgi:hypothetical protein